MVAEGRALDTEAATLELTLEQVARIAVELEDGTPRDAVLSAAGVSLESWEHSRDSWLSRIADDASRGRRRLHRRYVALVAARRAEVAGLARASRKRLEGPLPSAPAVSIPSVGAKTAVSAERALPAVMANPHVRRDPQPIHEAPAVFEATVPPVRQPTWIPQDASAPPASLADAVPFRPANAFSAGRPETTERPRAPPGSLGKTLEGPVQSPLRALPFDERGVPSRAEARAVRATSLGQTRDASAPKTKSSSATLPFKMPPLGVGGPVPSTSVEIRAAGQGLLNKTMDGTLSPRAGERSLPFEQRPAATRPPAAERARLGSTMGPQSLEQAQAAPLPFSTTPPRSNVSAASAPPSGPAAWAMPFQSAVRAGEKSSDRRADIARAEATRRVQAMSLGDYVALCAAVRQAPDKASDVRSSFGLDMASWTALHKLWQGHFQRDPSIRARWEALLAQATSAKR